MKTNERIIQAIYDAFDEINLQQPKERQLIKSVETVLFDKSGKLDSLGLVNLIVAVEDKIEIEFGVIINLAEENENQTNSPFKNTQTLADHVSLLLEKNTVE